MKRSVHYCLHFFFFPRFLSACHMMTRFRMRFSQNTLRVVLVGKGGQVLWGWGTQHKSGSTVSLCTGAHVPSVKLFSDFSLSSIHSFPFRCLCSKIKPLWSLHQRFGVYNNTAMVVTLNLRQHHDMLFFCEVVLALSAMNCVTLSRCFPLLCLISLYPHWLFRLTERMGGCLGRCCEECAAMQVRQHSQWPAMLMWP